MSQRYHETFAKLRSEDRLAFVPFWMCGDPTPQKSLEIIEKIAEFADILELGIGFSDPLADGRAIQDSSARAISSGATTQKSLEIIEKIRKKFPKKPIGCLVYLNLILNFGNGKNPQKNIENFFKIAKKSGVDSVLVPEIPVEEVSLVEKPARENEIDLIFLVSTNTPQNRLEKILEKSSGFLYAISTPSTTGTRSTIAVETLEMIEKLKKKTDLPIVVGFGISSPNHLEILKKSGASGGIIGSKLLEFRGDLHELASFCKKCQVACSAKN